LLRGAGGGTRSPTAIELPAVAILECVLKLKRILTHTLVVRNQPQAIFLNWL
jgi:hypothetical protein